MIVLKIDKKFDWLIERTVQSVKCGNVHCPETGSKCSSGLQDCGVGVGEPVHM